MLSAKRTALDHVPVPVQQGGERWCGAVARELEEVRVAVPWSHRAPSVRGSLAAGRGYSRPYPPPPVPPIGALVPVLVHAAHRSPARALARRLLEDGGQVRATAREGVALLRAEGIFTASCDPDDEGTLEAALTRVHTLVVLLGGLGRTDLDGLRREGLVAARAAEGAGIERAILVTAPGSDVSARDALRRTHGEVAAAFAELPLPSIEVRTGLVDTPATTDLLLGAGLPEEERARTVAPVPLVDLIELVVAIDHARSRAAEGHLVVAADGATRRSIEEHLALAAGASASGQGGRLTGRRIPSAGARDALLDALDGPWWEEDPLVPDAWSLFDVPVSTP